jgi:hypothetical protein
MSALDLRADADLRPHVRGRFQQLIVADDAAAARVEPGVDAGGEVQRLPQWKTLRTRYRNI